MDSDFPEFDHAYKTILVKDSTDKFEALAAKTNFNIYHSDIWRGTARRFAESIVKECLDKIETYRIPVGNSASGELACEWTYNALKEIRDDIKEHFGVKE